MSLIHTTEIDGQYPVKMYQRSTGKFDVYYGNEQYKHLDEVQAAREFGLCVMHALQCAGKID